MNKSEQIKSPSKAIEMVAKDDDGQRALPLLDTLIDNDAIVEWHKWEDGVPESWPNDCRGNNTVLALIPWTKLSHKKADGNPAIFYQAVIGEYVMCDDGNPRFMLDHGYGMADEIGEEGIENDYIDPPKWWTYMITPDRAGLE